MRRLNGSDAAMLYLDRGSAYNHTLKISVLDPSTDPDGWSWPKVRRMFEERAHLLPVLRLRYLPTPLGLHHPIWVEDPEFDLDAHVRRVVCPPPGGMEEFCALVEQVYAHPLDRDRPLWQIWVVEGFEGGYVALVTLVHHAYSDGVGVLDMLGAFYNDTPDDAAVVPAPWAPQPLPSSVQRLGWALRDLLEHIDVALIDGIGATEGAMGVQVSRRGDPLAQTGQFIRLGETKLFSEDGREIMPGSDEPGLIAAGGRLTPKGYYKDPEKSARVFREIDGQRYAFIGDWGRLEADGTLVLLGRGSGCINTAGEKVYPEEVEEVIKTHPDVADALVVGITDERFGQRVTAVVAPANPGTGVVEAINEYLTERLAGYKRPRVVVQVDAIKRAPNGKPDYAWARDVVLSEVERASSPA
jgi:Wax ester synthase-like Acyl-CoA acyltransferase domain/AMP-binding enzyme C-terminal domain/AMP-binding enzyme